VLAAAPLLVLYEVLILLTGATAYGGVRISADVWIKRLLGALGVTGGLALGAAALAIGAAVVAWERRQGVQPPLKAKWFGWLLAESLVYAVGLAALVGSAVGALVGFRAEPLMALLQPAFGLGTKLALSLGAGIYEELVFRVLLVGGLAWGLRKLMPGRGAAYAVAAVVGALIFSWVHYVGAFGDPFAVGSFLFRALFGLALNGVFLVRGFGCAVWTHALYDVLVVTGLLGLVLG
jgi:membrane protease YdiL (CAAX protease family)